MDTVFVNEDDIIYEEDLASEVTQYFIMPSMFIEHIMYLIEGVTKSPFPVMFSQINEKVNFKL